MVKNKPHDIGTLSPEMALLGLLYKAPGYGYKLHRQVVGDLGQVWHLSQSQAYSILKRLEAQGEISKEELPQEKLPTRQLLQMTPQGRSRFLDWLDTPSGGSSRAIRLEFVTRLYFLRMYMPEKIAQAFDRQRTEAERHLQQLKKNLSELPEEQIYNRMSVALRIEQLQAVLDWLDDSQKYFQSK
ncbi:MAG: PadR family transcriptional regulator [Anaerolineales bacterium]|jgi:DNA-binding PadR family transcriptional regulator